MKTLAQICGLTAVVFLSGCPSMTGSPSRPPSSVTERAADSFPPQVSTPPRVDYGPLKIVRHNPQEDKDVVQSVSVTFNQPFVPLSSLDALDDVQVPLTLSPKVEGTYRWLGTKTVSFVPEEPLPAATQFTATVAGSAAGISGEPLGEDFSWTFKTRLPRVVSMSPHGGERWAKGDTTVVLQFNQPVDFESLQGRVHLRAGKRALKFSIKGNVAGATGVPAVDADNLATRRVEIVPKRPLPLNAEIGVTVDPGVRGTQGPLAGVAAYVTSFRTYGPLQVGKLHCWSEPCAVLGSLHIQMTNPLDAEALKHIEFRPPLTRSDRSSVGSSLSVWRSFAPNTKYTITFKKTLRDQFGQKLGRTVKRTFRTGDYAPALALESKNAVRERSSKTGLAAQFVNVDEATVRVTPVSEDNLAAAWTWVHETAEGRYWDHKYLPPEPALKNATASVTKIRTAGGLNQKVNRDIALGPKPGVHLVELRAKVDKPRWVPSAVHDESLVQSTSLGLNVWYDYDQMLVWLTRLGDTQVVGGARVAIRGSDGALLWEGMTAGDGTVVVPGANGLDADPPYFLVASQGDDMAFLRVDGNTLPGGQWLYAYTNPDSIPTPKRLVGHITSERGIYRPGEKAYVKGTLRLMDRDGIAPMPKSVRQVHVTVHDPRGQKLLEEDVDLNARGSFHLTVQTEAKGSLGNFRVDATPIGLDEVEPRNASGSFQVQAYRAPEFAVSASVERGDYLVGDVLRGKVVGTYLFGAPMRRADTNWYLRGKPSNFYPKGWSGYTFGGTTQDLSWSPVGIANGSGKLDADGGLEMTAKLEAIGPVPYEIEFSAEVIDANRQSVAGRARATLHPASVYLGVGVDGWVFTKGKTIPTKIVGVGIDHEVVPNVSGAVSLQRSEWKLVVDDDRTRGRNRWEVLWPEVARCSFTTGAEPVDCAGLTPSAGGYYRIVATAKDSGGRPTQTVRHLWVAGPEYKSGGDDPKVGIIVDKERYEVGDTAKVLITSPFPKARALITFSRLGLVEHRDLGEIGTSKLLEIPVTPASIPGLRLGVVLVRGGGEVSDKEGGKAERPTVVSGSGSLVVSTDSKGLDVSISPSEQELRPGASTSLKVTTKGADGTPAQSELMVAVVDEGVLSLIGFKTPNPLDVFWALRSAELAGLDVRPDLVKGEAAVRLRDARHRSSVDGRLDAKGKKKEAKSAAMKAPGEEGVMKDAGQEEAEAERAEEPAPDSTEKNEGDDGPRVRTRFETTAWYMAQLETDDRGVAQIEIEMPDNLTTFRVMAVAQDGDRFGAGEASITINQPLLLRAALPRFALPGDRFTAGVVVNNETGVDGVATVTVEAKGAVVVGDSSRAVPIAAGAAAEVAFPVETPTAGRATFTYVVRFEGGQIVAQDAVRATMPVQRPVTTESVATYGTTTSAVAIGLEPPAEVYPDIGGLEVTLSSTILTNLQDAVAYLVEYPYGCLEQTASRLLPLIVLKDLVVRYGIAGLDDKEVDSMLRNGLGKIESLQRWNGGFSYWPGSSAYPYPSIYALFVLNEAKRRGHVVDDDVFQRGTEYVSEVLTRRRNPETGRPLGPVTLSFAAAVLSEVDASRVDMAALAAVYRERTKMPLFARAFLALAYANKSGVDDPKTQQLLSDLSNNAVEEASDAHFAEPKADTYAEFFNSNSRTDAIALMTYLRIAPDDVLVPKVARGLMEARVRGRWGNTQENAYALVALDRYAAHYEKEEPDFRARLWRGDTFLVESDFQGRDTEPAMQDIPMRDLQGTTGDLVLAKEGPGRLYYRLGMTYAPKTVDLPARENGFSVTRRYFVDGKPVGTEEVEVAAGSYVKVHLTVVVPVERHWIVVDDPFPAGVEPVNLGFATSLSTLDAQSGTQRQSHWGHWWTVSWDHTELRDDRSLLFADRLPPGVYEHSYVVRATTPGTFYLAPARVSEMYQPEVMGRTASGRFVVVP